jgi:hypothetical protein
VTSLPVTADVAVPVGHGNIAAGLDLEAKSRLLSKLNNHFGLYLYGKQIVALQALGLVLG